MENKPVVQLKTTREECVRMAAELATLTDSTDRLLNRHAHDAIAAHDLLAEKAQLREALREGYEALMRGVCDLCGDDEQSCDKADRDHRICHDRVIALMRAALGDKR